ncbi:hypothetical protein [Faecalicoccus pleomorphus]|uniref:hypothetical protein n=1 Tax=Faecalicoccus pleomorphus TaxID=1323 RepID=UPI0025A4B505|nr:hypothetical protein [Faecalicoccus pleomorphus]MDM8292916.1 hypothetical protein [Faecalicoccus pleomorphus]
MKNKIQINNLKDTAKKAIDSTHATASSIASYTKNKINDTQQSVVKVIDVNGNGQVDIEDFIILGLKTPGIRIQLEDFLRAEFMKKFPKDTIEKAIASTPAQSGIPIEDINEIADQVIQYERNCVSGISAALGVPGGFSMVATIPTDIVQYYGYMLRAAQKLMYLYGFPEIDTNENNQKFDSETLNILILCLGAMYGVQGANAAIKALAKAFAEGVQKKMMKAALTKGTIYPIVKSISKWFGVNMTKQVFSGFFKKAIPVVGGVIGGGLTYLSFKPCCLKLKHSLEDTILSNPSHKSDHEETALVSGMILQAKN